MEEIDNLQVPEDSDVYRTTFQRFCGHRDFSIWIEREAGGKLRSQMHV